MTTPTVLLLGSNGQIGWELRRQLGVTARLCCPARRPKGHLQPALDLYDLDAIASLLEHVQPDFIVNAAAYTSVDKAESEPDLAFRLNAQLPAALGRWASGRRCAVIHYSTDYVFDGEKQAAYVETDRTNPLNVYGRTKLAGDEALLSSNANAVILRISWIYSQRRSNFLITMKRLMSERDTLDIVADQYGAPTWAGLVANATAHLLHRWFTNPGEVGVDTGLYHFAPHGTVSWFEFAQRIQAAFGLDCQLAPISAAEYPVAAQRPRNSALESAKFERTFSYALPHWQSAFEECIEH